MNSRWSRYGAHQEPDFEQVDVMMRVAQELATDRMVLGRLSFVRCEDWKCLQEPLSSAAPHSSQSPRFSSARQFLLSCLRSRRNMSKRRSSPPMPRMGRFTVHFFNAHTIAFLQVRTIGRHEPSSLSTAASIFNADALSAW